MMIKRGGLNQDSPLFQVNTKLYKDCNGAKLNDHYGNNMYMKNRFLKSFYSHIVIQGVQNLCPPFSGQK